MNTESLQMDPAYSDPYNMRSASGASGPRTIAQMNTNMGGYARGSSGPLEQRTRTNMNTTMRTNMNTTMRGYPVPSTGAGYPAVQGPVVTSVPAGQSSRALGHLGHSSSTIGGPERGRRPSDPRLGNSRTQTFQNAGAAGEPVEIWPDAPAESHRKRLCMAGELTLQPHVFTVDAGINGIFIIGTHMNSAGRDYQEVTLSGQGVMSFVLGETSLGFVVAYTGQHTFKANVRTELLPLQLDKPSIARAKQESLILLMLQDWGWQMYDSVKAQAIAIWKPIENVLLKIWNSIMGFIRSLKYSTLGLIDASHNYSKDELATLRQGLGILCFPKLRAIRTQAKMNSDIFRDLEDRGYKIALKWWFEELSHEYQGQISLVNPDPDSALRMFYLIFFWLGQKNGALQNDDNNLAESNCADILQLKFKNRIDLAGSGFQTVLGNHWSIYQGISEALLERFEDRFDDLQDLLLEEWVVIPYSEQYVDSIQRALHPKAVLEDATRIRTAEPEMMTLAALRQLDGHHLRKRFPISVNRNGQWFEILYSEIYLQTISQVLGIATDAQTFQQITVRTALRQETSFKEFEASRIRRQDWVKERFPVTVSVRIASQLHPMTKTFEYEEGTFVKKIVQFLHSMGVASQHMRGQQIHVGERISLNDLSRMPLEQQKRRFPIRVRGEGGKVIDFPFDNRNALFDLGQGGNFVTTQCLVTMTVGAFVDEQNSIVEEFKKRFPIKVRKLEKDMPQLVWQGWRKEMLDKVPIHATRILCLVARDDIALRTQLSNAGDEALRTPSSANTLTSLEHAFLRPLRRKYAISLSLEEEKAFQLGIADPVWPKYRMAALRFFMFGMGNEDAVFRKLAEGWTNVPDPNPPPQPPTGRDVEVVSWEMEGYLGAFFQWGDGGVFCKPTEKFGCQNGFSFKFAKGQMSVTDRQQCILTKQYGEGWLDATITTELGDRLFGGKPLKYKVDFVFWHPFMKPITDLPVQENFLRPAQAAMQAASTAEDGFGMLQTFFSTLAPILSATLFGNEGLPLIADFSNAISLGLSGMKNLAGIARDAAASLVNNLVAFPDIRVDVHARLLITCTIANDPMFWVPGIGVIGIGVDRVADAVAEGTAWGYKAKMEFIYAAATQLIFKRSRSCIKYGFGDSCPNCQGKSGASCVIEGGRFGTCHDLGQCTSGGHARLDCDTQCVEFNGFVQHKGLNTKFCLMNSQINKAKTWIDEKKRYFLFWCSKYSHYRIAKMQSFHANLNGDCLSLTQSKSVSYLGPSWDEFSSQKRWQRVEKVLATCIPSMATQPLPVPTGSEMPPQSMVDDQADSSPSGAGVIIGSRNYDNRLTYAVFVEPGECRQGYVPILDQETCGTAARVVTNSRIQYVMELGPAIPPYYQPFGCWFWSQVLYDNKAPDPRSQLPVFLVKEKGNRYTGDVPYVAAVCQKG